jgi:hypothetical protein
MDIKLAKKRLSAATDNHNEALDRGCSKRETARLEQEVCEAREQYNQAVASAGDGRQELAGVRQVAHLI